MKKVAPRRGEVGIKVCSTVVVGGEGRVGVEGGKGD